jgi:ABC-type transporter Mla MlaB component
MLPQWRLNQVARLDSSGLALMPVPAVTQAAAQ